MRILLVEDEHKIAAAIKRGLEQEQFAVDVIYDGREALGFATTEDYDLVILDRMLPNISDGLNICKAMRDKGIHTPVLVLTAKDQVEERVSGLGAGADDYLIKPFAFEELLARARALLRRPQQQLSEVLQVSDLQLNTQTYEVTRQGQTIQLTSKEFSLLEYLMRNQGRTITKNMIINHVWDYDADVLPNTVEVYMGYLRNKIERPFRGALLLHTIRGFGYKIGEK